jgi:hypothetical protein
VTLLCLFLRSQSGHVLIGWERSFGKSASGYGLVALDILGHLVTCCWSQGHASSTAPLCPLV